MIFLLFDHPNKVFLCTLMLIDLFQYIAYLVLSIYNQVLEVRRTGPYLRSTTAYAS
jgi:hypothetical protein